MWLMNSSVTSPPGSTGGAKDQDKKGLLAGLGYDDDDSSMPGTPAEPEPEDVEDLDTPPTPTYLEPWEDEEEEEEHGEDEQPPTPSHLEPPPGPLLRQRSPDAASVEAPLNFRPSRPICPDAAVEAPRLFRPSRHVRWSDELGHDLEDVQPEPDPESRTDPATNQDRAVRDNQELIAGAAVTQSGGFGLLLLLLL